MKIYFPIGILSDNNPRFFFPDYSFKQMGYGSGIVLVDAISQIAGFLQNFSDL